MQRWTLISSDDGLWFVVPEDREMDFLEYVHTRHSGQLNAVDDSEIPNYARPIDAPEHISFVDPHIRYPHGLEPIV